MIAVRSLLAVLLLAPTLALPATARATPLLAAKLASADVRYGVAHRLSGTLTDGGRPLAGQPVVLEGQRFPFEGSFREIARATTAADGAFSFGAQLDRNHRLRVVAPAQDAFSPVLAAYTLPSFELGFHQVTPGVVRITQRYSVPASVRLSAPTLFYLGPRAAKVASRRVSVATVRTSAGHYTASATVRLPKAWHGRFRYGSCFRTSPGSGMGEPAASCPRLALRF